MGDIDETRCSKFPPVLAGEIPTPQENCPVRGCCRWSLRKASCREDQALPLLIANVTVEEVLEDWDAEAQHG